MQQIDSTRSTIYDKALCISNADSSLKRKKLLFVESSKSGEKISSGIYKY